MSRHRNVRSMNYQDEYDGYDDVYGHSVEDDYCVSPGTAAQFTYNRNNDHPLASFLGDEEIPEEGEEEQQEELDNSLQDSTGKQEQLSDIDQARLNSCLEELRNIVGETTPEQQLISACISCNYDIDKVINTVLNKQEAPKPQRTPRDRRTRGSRGGSQTTKTNGDSVQPPASNPAADVTTKATEASHVTGMARMTFTSGKQAVSGFTPEKEEDRSETGDGEPALKKSVKKNLRSQMDSPSTPTHSREDPSKTPSKKLELDKPISRNASSSDLGAMAKSSKLKLDKDALREEYDRRKNTGKEHINLVVVGHVDAGKSTLMGHVLYLLGFVNKRTMHKYETESKKLGKASFAYAWVLDETEEERSRGVTMDVAQTGFETDTKVITLLDAPGHKDFIPNMITGAAQADVAVLVVNATRGEFETGFEAGGQTREHAMLIRSLGVSQLVVAVNKMDTVDWSRIRFDEISRKLGQFLKQAGFKESDVRCVPCSGLDGENLVTKPTEAHLISWYSGPTLVQQIDRFEAPLRQVEQYLRMCVTDVFKSPIGSGLSVSGTLQAGNVQAGERVLVMPQGEPATVKSVTIDDVPAQCAFAGDNVVLTLINIEIQNISVGSILCDPSSPVKSTSRLKARIVIFNIDLPITKGFPVVFHYQSLSEAAHIRKLISQLHKNTGEVLRNKPRCLTKNTSAVIELELQKPVCIELYRDFKDLGRFMLRYGGSTIAAGVVTEIVEKKT